MIDRQTVKNIAKLARLEISEMELEKYTQQLNQILTFVEKLNELDTRSIEATSHAVLIPNPMREDHVVPSAVIHDVLKQSPDHEETFFRVPKVI